MLIQLFKWIDMIITHGIERIPVFLNRERNNLKGLLDIQLPNFGNGYR